MNANPPVEAGWQHIPCDICKTDRWSKPIASQGQFNIPIHVVICKKCGLVYLSPRWSKERYKYFYENEYDSYYRKSMKDVDQSVTRPKETIDRTLVLTRRSSFPSVLDIGSGPGWTLVAARDYLQSTHLAAIEPSPSSIKEMEQRGIDIIATDVDDDWHIDRAQKYDLVIMRHVLEHFLDPISVLTKVRQVLKPEGVLYVAVPDMMHPIRSLNAFWFRAVHTYYFAIPTLAAICAMAGLRFTVGGQINGELYGIATPGTVESQPFASHVLKQRIVLFIHILKSIALSMLPLIKFFLRPVRKLILTVVRPFLKRGK